MEPKKGRSKTISTHKILSFPSKSLLMISTSAIRGRMIAMNIKKIMSLTNREKMIALISMENIKQV